MSDLYRGLIKQNGRQHSFWGKYAYLNQWDQVNLSDSVLFRLQLVHLKNLEQSANKQYNAASEFIKLSSQLLQLEEQEMDKQIEESIYSRILQLMNSAFISSELSPFRDSDRNWISDKEKINQNIDNIMIEVQSILQKIKPGEGIDQAIVQRLEDVFANRKAKGKMKEYQQAKADYAEVLATDALNKNEGWKAIRTGNFVDKMGQQLIEDVMAFSKNSVNIPFTGGSLNYRIKNKIDSSTSIASAGSLNDFFKQIEKLNANYTITLSDELYGALQQASILNTQVKSGMNGQPILTRAARNAITLAECGFSDFGLWRLYTQQDSYKYFKLDRNQDSKQLNAIANYYLSKSIGKTNLAKNQLYYTELGFTTASRWMEVNKYMLKFFPAINSMALNMLTLSRQYRFRQVQ